MPGILRADLKTTVGKESKTCAFRTFSLPEVSPNALGVHGIRVSEETGQPLLVQVRLEKLSDRRDFTVCEARGWVIPDLRSSKTGGIDKDGSRTCSAFR